MDVERALISKALKERAIVKLIDRGIKAEYFPTPDHATAFQWMLDYYREYGDAPTTKAYKQDYPAYKLVTVEEPIDFLIDALRTQQQYSVLDGVLFDATEARKDGAKPQDLLAMYSAAVSHFNTDFTEMRDCDVTRNYAERLARYEELEKLVDGMRGITTGFPSIDGITAGLQAGQLITVIGAPKAGKTMLLLRMAIAAHDTDHNVLFVGFEMTNDEMQERYDMVKAGVAHERLRRGALQNTEKSRLKHWLSAPPPNTTKSFVFSQDVTSATTLSGLQAKIKTYGPEVLYVDGTYMMDDEYGEEKGTPRHLTNLTRGMKRMAQQLEIPVVITTQVLTWKLARNKKKTGGKITADAIGYSSSFAQDSDLILGLENGASDIEKELRIIMARNSGRGDVPLMWDWTNGDFNEMGDLKRRPSSYDDDGEEEDDDHDLIVDDES